MVKGNNDSIKKPMEEITLSKDGRILFPFFAIGCFEIVEMEQKRWICLMSDHSA
jgi:hypothetical protein